MSVADDQKRLSAEVFQSSKVEIERIEKDADVSAATEELAVAKRFIENGNLLLRAGHTKKAALYAERLQLQLELIRAVVAARVAERTAEAVKGEIRELENELSALEERYRKMLQVKENEDRNRNAEP